MKEKKDERLNKPQEKRENPYKELASYEERDRKEFYGREEETETLFQLVSSNSLTVVFGKSGFGKTSLLNAGLLPRLKEEEFLPIRLRLHYSTDAPPLKRQIHQTILNEFRKFGRKVKIQGKDEPAKPLEPDESLWEYFHRVRHFTPLKNGDKKELHAVTPVLVFDQFEELFTLGKSHDDKDILIDELYWLIENQLPPTLRERTQKNDEVEKDIFFPPDPPDVRIVISLREEYLPHLTDLKSRIPSIDQTTFRVIHLNGEQARKIINMPNGIQNERITDSILRMFYPTRAEEVKEIPEKKLEIEPSILSVICSQVIKDKSFAKKDRERILTAYYDSVLKTFPQEVEGFIEDNLINERGNRMLFLMEQEHPLEKFLRQLEDQRILRKINLDGRFYIELIHDVLTPTVFEKRNKRMNQIRKKELKKKLRKRYARIAIGFVFILVVILAWISWYAFKQYENAQINRLTAEALLKFPEDNTKAVRIAEAAYEMGLPNPPPRTYRVLSEIGYSSYEKHFYITRLHHNGAIYKAVFSADANRILTASADGFARLWDVNGKRVMDFKHGDIVSSAVFSPDETHILTASWDKNVRIWDLQGNTSLILPQNAVVNSAVYSHDDKFILSSARDGKVRVWNLEGIELVSINHVGVSSAVFSPNDDRILTASWDKTVTVWQRDGQFLFDLKHNGAVSSGVFSKDSNRILTASEDGIAKLWTQEGELLKDFEHKGTLVSAMFSHDGQRILTASRDGTIKIWSLKGELLTDLKYVGELYSVVFSPNDRMILIASKDGTAEIWNLEGNILVDFKKHTKDVKTAVISPDNQQILIVSADGTVRLWNQEGRFQQEIEGKKKTETFWDPESPRRKSFDEPIDPVSFAVFSPNGNRILTISEAGISKVWDIDNVKVPLLELKNEGKISSALFSPDGNRILTALEDGTAKIWDIDNVKVPLLELKNEGKISSAVFSPDGNRILTALEDGTAKIWDIDNVKVPLLVLKIKGKIFSAVFSSDGPRILAISHDSTAKVWNFKNEQLLEIKYSAPITSAVFSPNGQRILIASEDGTVKYWDVQGHLLADLDKHKAMVNSALFSPDGSRILTVTQDNTLKIWYTPEKIFDWLKTAKIPTLTEEDEKKLGI